MTLRPDPDHDAVCRADGRRHVVIAPPGTGKTCLSVRLAGAIAPMLAEFERILLVTFSNQARIQLEHESARQLRSDVRRQIEVVNYHGFFRREVWAHRRALGLPLDAQIGSFRRRREALRAADAEAIEALRHREGLLEALAELRSVRFRDENTPEQCTLERLLVAVELELRAGRLVFDDLGSLFWSLLETYPVLDDAYKARYPVVIADEHQDASELQDAVVRRLGGKRIVILADPMQQIYGFRGSRPERLQRHVDEADEVFELRTPHRWAGDEQTGRWLLAVRARLSGSVDETLAPPSLQIIRSEYFSQMKARTKEQAARAFRDGLETVAVIAAFNNEVNELRSYLSRAGLFPRQLGGGEDFEDAHEDIERLPLLADIQSVANHALDRIAKLAPTLARSTVVSVRRRLHANRVELKGRVGSEAAGLLRALELLYKGGPSHYFAAVLAALDACAERKHHLPRVEAVRAIRATAEERYGLPIDDVGAALTRYAENVMSAAQAAPRLGRGIYVMTAHQAKGKEFDAIICANAGRRQFPDSDEGRRLLYVAVTRGSKRWVIIAPEREESPLLKHLG